LLDRAIPHTGQVRKVLRSGETSFEYERQVQSRPKLGRWVSLLEIDHQLRQLLDVLNEVLRTAVLTAAQPIFLE
jgi:hypothetical protein